MPRFAAVVAAWGCAALLLGLHSSHFHHLADDAFISFRYLENWLAGDGLVFNVGERVEGYTNFLWIVVLAAAGKLYVSPLMAAPVLGVACMAGAMAVLWTITQPTRGTLRSTAALFVVACCGPVAYWAAAGLETGLFCLGIALLLASVWREKPEAAGLAGAFLCMTRPDGAVYVIAAGLGFVLLQQSTVDKPTRLRNALRYAVCFALLYGPYFLWRWSYYDALLPNTFYAKVGGGISSLARGFEYIGAFVLVSGSGLLILALLLINRFSSAQDEGLVPNFQKYLIAFATANLLFVLVVGGDQLVMFRFLVPLIVLLVPTTSAAFFTRLPSRYVIPAACVLGAVAVIPSFFGPMVHRVTDSERPADEARAEIGQWLEAHTREDTLIAVVPAGILPYYAKRPTLDLVGLNDRHIGRAEVEGMGTGAAGHERHDANYVMEREPDIMFLGAALLWEAPLSALQLDEYVRQYGEFAPAVRTVYQHPDFHSAYSVRAIPINGRYAHAWVRNGFDGWRGSTS